MLAHPLVDSEEIACIGHSLGGRTAVYLGAFDERVKATVASTGVSPNATNVFRNHTTDPARSFSPRLNEEVLKTGVPPKEYRSVAAAYKEAVSGERMVLGMEGTGQSGWPDEMVVKWVDEEAGAGERAENAS